MKIDVIRSGGQSQGGLDQSGGTLSGPLMLSRNPQLPLEAATKAYIDAELQTLNASNFTTGTLAIARLPVFSGDVSNEAGSNTINLSNSGVTAAEYGKIVVNEKGRVTNGTVLAGSDIPNIGFDKIISDKPSTLNGYGITDGVPVSGVLMTGALNLSSNPSTSENLVTKQYVDGMVNSLSSAKTGDIVRKSYSTTPVGFLKCNGAEVDKTTYADLYAIVGETNNSYNVIGSGKPWCKQYEFNNSQSVDVGPWSTGTALPVNLMYHSAFVTKNRVYLCGGYSGTTIVSTVYTAVINIDGTLGAWTTSTSLPGVVGYAQAIVTKNRVYLLGGSNDTVYLSTVYTAPINVDGTLGAWTTSASLPGTLSGSQAILTKKYVYMLGGSAVQGTAVSTVYRAPINSDGTLGTWTTDTSLPGALGYSQAITTKNRIYLLGGWSGGSAVSTVYTAPINSDGTLGTWATGTSIPNTVTFSQSVVTKNRVYLLGGINISSVYLSTVYTAPINDDGTLGTWTTGTALPGILGHSQTIVTKNKIYMIGGYNSATTSIVYVANFSGGMNDYSVYFNEDTTNYMMSGSGKPWQQQYQINTTQTGDITGWSTGTALPITLSGSAVIMTKNRVYLMGGYNGTGSVSSVYTAPINADGTLGAWSTTTSLPGVISSAEAFVTKNRVYVLSGYIGTPYTNPVATVYTAPINSDGTLGAWTTGTSLPVALQELASVVTKNRVYLIGGYSSGFTVASVYTAPINADGTLGTWVSATSLPQVMRGVNLVVTKNRIYVIGGYNDGNSLTAVYSATITMDGVIGPWVTGPTLPIGIFKSQTIVTKNRVYLLGGCTTSAAISSVYISTISDEGILGSWVAGTALPGALYASSSVVTKNRIYLLGGLYNFGNYSTSVVYTAVVSEGLNDYSPYYDGTVTPLEPANPSTLFKLPDMSAIDVNGLYHYIKY